MAKAKATHQTREQAITEGAQSALIFVNNNSKEFAEDFFAIEREDMRLKAELKELRESSNLKYFKEKLTNTQHIAPWITNQIPKLLRLSPGEAAAQVVQFIHSAKECGLMEGDLVTMMGEAEASKSTARGDHGQGSVFDKTSEGQRRGGTKAQPKPVEQKEEPAAPKPSEGIPAAEALKMFEAARDAAVEKYAAVKTEKGYEGKGRKPKEVKAAEVEMEEAERKVVEAKAQADAVTAPVVAAEKDAEFEGAAPEGQTAEAGADGGIVDDPEGEPEPVQAAAPPPPRQEGAARPRATGRIHLVH